MNNLSQANTFRNTVQKGVYRTCCGKTRLICRYNRQHRQTPALDLATQSLKVQVTSCTFNTMEGESRTFQSKKIKGISPQHRWHNSLYWKWAEW